MVKGSKNRKKILETIAELRQYKEDHGCLDCKNKFPHYVLEFDHRPEFKKIDGIHRVLRAFGPGAAWKEVAKCDVVCANCHKTRTYLREAGYDV
jgi:hypothetical protein